jgi:hypothetical protein
MQASQSILTTIFALFSWVALWITSAMGWVYDHRWAIFAVFSLWAISSPLHDIAQSLKRIENKLLYNIRPNEHDR